MSHHPDLSVSLDQLLLRKEVRVRQQGEWLKRHSLPLVSFTVNMPGAVKLNAASQTVMDAGMRAIQELCQQTGWRQVACQLLVEKNRAGSLCGDSGSVGQHAEKSHDED